MASQLHSPPEINSSDVGAVRKSTVLIVEDEPIILLDALSIAEEAGFVALGVTDADQAMRLLDSRPDIRIVFTDIEMPGSMNGINLAKVIRNRWPPVELIVTSGKLNLRSADLPERGVFLSKPYSADSLKAALHSLVH